MSLAAFRPLAFGEVLDQSFSLYRKLFAPLLIVSLVSSAIPLLLNLVATMQGGWQGAPVLTVASLVLSIVGGSVATATSTFLIAGYLLGRPVDTADAFARATPKIWPLVLASVLFGLVFVIGLVLLLVPGFIAMAGLVLAFTALTVENLGPMDALGRSWELTKGFKWRMFGLMMVFAAILYILMIGSGIIIGIVMAVGGVEANAGADLAAGQMPVFLVALSAGTAVVQLVVNPVLYCLLVTAYYDMRVRKEGFDLELLATTMEQPAAR